MTTNEKGTCRECPPRMQAPQNYIQDNNTPTQKKQSCWFYILAISAMTVSLKIHRVLRRGI